MLNLPTNSLESCPVPVTAKGSWIKQWIELVGNCYSIENKGSDILNRYIERRRQIVCIGMAEEVIGYWMDAHLDTRAIHRVDIIYWSCRKATYNRFRILFSIQPVLRTVSSSSANAQNTNKGILISVTTIGQLCNKSRSFPLLHSSDGLSHSTRRLMEEHRHKLLQNITELLRRTFPSQFVFPVLGHEDGQATNFRHLADLWQTWLPSEALTTFERGELGNWE